MCKCTRMWAEGCLGGYHQWWFGGLDFSPHASLNFKNVKNEYVCCNQGKSHNVHLERNVKHGGRGVCACVEGRAKQKEPRAQRREGRALEG